MACLVTGSSTGVGREIASRMFEQGLHVFVSGRDRLRCEQACEAIVRSSPAGGGKVEPLPMDLSDFDSVREAAKQLEGKPLKYLFLNAGMVYKVKETGPWMNAGGYDMLFASNFLGHFLLCELLIANLKMAAPSRIVITSSNAHWIGREDFLFRKGASLEQANDFTRFQMYATSKLANILHAYELQRRFQSESVDIEVIPITPGLVSSEILCKERGKGKSFGFLPMAVEPKRGAEPAVFAALTEQKFEPGSWCVPYWVPRELPRGSGFLMLILEMFQKLSWKPRVTRSSPTTYNESLARELMKFAEDATGLSGTN